jgi:hypothetical protein
LYSTPCLELLFLHLQIPDKAGRLAQLRTAVTQAGHQLPDSALRQALLAEAVEQFKRNNAVVAEFRVGWRAVLHAAQLALHNSWVLTGVAVAGAAGAAAAAAAAGVWPAGVLSGQ